MKNVKVKSFEIHSVDEKVLTKLKESSEKIHKGNKDKLLKDVIHNANKGDGFFLGITTDPNELFKFIPIIDGNNLFAAPIPDPIQLYYSIAYTNYQSAEKARINIVSQKDQENHLNYVGDLIYNWFLKSKITSIIFLHSTIEAFINYIMPEDFIYRQKVTGNKSDKFLTQTKELNKHQTEKYIQFKEKISEVIFQLTKVDLVNEHKKNYDVLLRLNSFRNDIIHLRSLQEKNTRYFEKVFKEVVNSNLEELLDNVQNFINLIKPNFIEFEDLEKKDNSTFHLKFENYKAFKLDISIFLDIMQSKQKNVVLTIPKTNDKGFSTLMKWIFQNIEIMVQKNLIYFPTTSHIENNLVKIEIVKTERQLIT